MGNEELMEADHQRRLRESRKVRADSRERRPVLKSDEAVHAQQHILKQTQELLVSLRGEEHALVRQIMEIRKQQELLEEQVRVSRALLGLDPEPDLPSTPPRGGRPRRSPATGDSRESSERLTSVAAGRHLSIRQVVMRLRIEQDRPLPQPDGLKREADPESSVYRSALVLRAARESVTAEFVHEVFEAMDWIEPEWKDSRANVAQAVRRAEGYGWARRDPEDDSLFRYRRMRPERDPREALFNEGGDRDG